MADTGAAGPRFEIVRHLGEGGMGVVYEARDGETGGLVALKTLRAPHAESLLRLKQEFRALQDIHHPNLVRYHALVEEDARWYLAMELVRGVDLRSYVWGGADGVPAGPAAPAASAIHSEAPTMQGQHRSAAGPEVDHDRLRSVFGQLASALCGLHASGKVHRDLKPSNVLVQDSGRVVLLDFGLVTEGRGDAAWTGHNVVGTVAYMAPEQAAGGQPVGPAADWYAVGVMLYELLTGRVPFEGAQLRVLADKQHLAPVPIAEHAAGVPEELAALCARLLAPEPGDRPAGLEVLAAFGGAPIALGTATPSSLARDGELIGRARELEALRQWLPEPGETGTTVALVTGESGVGKTAVVERFLAGCAADGAVVLRGKCYERETVPFRAIDAVVDALAGYLKSLPVERAAQLVPRRAALLVESFPVLRGVRAFGDLPTVKVADPHERRQLMFDALRELLAGLGERTPLVVSIDDFHWVDGDSVALLRRVLLDGQAPAMLLVATWRPINEHPADEHPAGEHQADEHTAGEHTAPPALPGRCERLEVARLSEAEAVKLAHQRLRGAPDAERLAVTLAREAGGHPLFIDELARHALTGGDAPAGEAAMSLDHALWQRVERLPADARRLVELVAIAGRPLERGVVAGALELETAALEPLVRPLLVTRLLRSSRARDREALEPYHDRVRDSVRERVGDDDARGYHRALARAMRAVGDPDRAALARHLAAAGETDEAAEIAERAGQDAVAGLAFDRGAALFRAAVELVGADPARRGRLWSQLGDALAQAGRPVDAARAYDAAREGATAAGALEMQWRAAQQWLIGGHLDEGLAALEPVLRARGVKLPGTPRAALWSLAWQRARLRLRGVRYTHRDETEVAADTLALVDLYWYVGSALGPFEPIRGNDFYTRGVRAALRAGEPRRVARALYVEALFRSFAGTRTEPAQRRLLRRADAVAEAAGGDDPHLIALADLSAGTAAMMRGELAVAWPSCWRAAERLRTDCPGATLELSTARAHGGVVLSRAGDLQRLRNHLPAWLHDSRARGHRFALEELGSDPTCRLALAAGRPGEVISSAHAILDFFPFSVITALYLESGMAAQVYLGSGKSAIELFEACRAALRGSMVESIHGFRALLAEALGRAAVCAATPGSIDAGRYRRLAARAARRVAGCAVVPAAGWAAAIRAGLASLDGNAERALAELDRAEPSFEAAGMGLHVAAVRRRRGQLLSGDEGAALIAEADAAFAAQGVVNPPRFAAMHLPGRFPGDEAAGLLEPARVE